MTFQIDPTALPKIRSASPNGDTLLREIHAMIPSLRRRSAQAEEEGAIPEETVEGVSCG